MSINSYSRRTAIAALAGMVGAAAAAEWARPTVKVSDSHKNFKLDDVFPASFAGWTTDTSMPVVLPPPDQQAMLDKIYNQTLSRSYVNRDGVRVMLAVAYGGDQSDGLTVHVPDVCYISQGFKVDKEHDSQIDVGKGFVIPVRVLQATLGGRIEPITYWVMMGNEATVSNAQRRWVSIRYGLRRLIPEGMLIRVSSISADMDQALDMQRGFIRDMVAAIAPSERSRVVGEVSLNRNQG